MKKMLNNVAIYGKALLNNLDGGVTPFLSSRLWRRLLKSPAAGDDDVSTGEIANVLYCLPTAMVKQKNTTNFGKSMSFFSSQFSPFENVKKFYP